MHCCITHPRDILDKGLPISVISDIPLYSSRSLYYEMISRASFSIVLSIGAVLFAIWPNILPLQQHLAMGIPCHYRPLCHATPAAGAPANTTAGAPANTTAGAPANTTAAEAPEAGDPAGEEVVPHWYGGAPCPDNSCHD